MSQEELSRLRFYFGSLSQSMLTLFMSISNGVSWVEVCTPLRKIEMSWLLLFLVYIVFTYFAVLNVITGLFCQSAIESQEKDKDTMLHAFLANKEMYIRRFKTLFHTMDTDASGVITQEEFETHITDFQVQTYFAMLGLDPEDATSLFALLDDDENTDPGIEVEEFVHGCLQLKGWAKSVDLAKVRSETRHISRELVHLSAYVKQLL